MNWDPSAACHLSHHKPCRAVRSIALVVVSLQNRAAVQLGLVVGLVQTPSGPRLNVACHAKSGSSVGLCLKVANLERVPEEDDVAAPEAELLQERDKLSDVGTSVSALPVSTI